MHRVFGPLLLLGLCAATGCALSEPDNKQLFAKRCRLANEKYLPNDIVKKSEESPENAPRRSSPRLKKPLLQESAADQNLMASRLDGLPAEISDGEPSHQNHLRHAGHSLDRSSDDSAPPTHTKNDSTLGAMAEWTLPRGDTVARNSSFSSSPERSPYPPLWPNQTHTKFSRRTAEKLNLHSSPDHGQSVDVQPVSKVSFEQSPTESDRLIAQMEKEISLLNPGSNPEALIEYRRRQVHLRFLYLVAQRQEQALTAIPGLPAAEQEYWQNLIWATSNSLDSEPFPLLKDRAARSISPLNTALRRLREQADLALKNTSFCEQISYFGNYEKFAKDEFTPGQEVLLYVEIENYKIEQTMNGEHRTLLRSVIDILGINGEVRWHKTFPATEDRCRNPRRDYFHNYQFTIPDRLPLGPHTLKLTVIDDLSGKQASHSLNFLMK
jgi:hypothetical protein